MAITVSNISICSVPVSTDYFTQMPSGVSDSRNLFSTLGSNIYELSGNDTFVTIFENDILKIEGKAYKNDSRPSMDELKFYDKRISTLFDTYFVGNLRNCYLAFGYDDSQQLAYFLLAGQYYYTGEWDYISGSYYGILGATPAERQQFYELISGSQTISHTANGGGATHIAKRTGQLKDLSSYTSDILMVSGGGGGGLLVGETAYSGKEAGGISGSGDNSADQSTGNAFGQGESGTNLSGGGSGLYGGYKGTSSKSGGAGSGYIGNSLLSNKKMIGYNVPTSSAEGTKTESVEVFDSNYVANKPKAGNGHCRIKFLRNSNPVVLLSYADGIKHEILDSYVDYSQEGSGYGWEFSDSSSNPELYNQRSAGNCEIKFTTPLQRYKATKMYVSIRTFTDNITWRGVFIAFYKNLDLFPQTGIYRNDSWFNFKFAMYYSENTGSGYLCDQATEAGCVYPIITPQMRIEIDISSMPSDQTFYLGFWKCNLGSYIQEISFNDEILILEE